MLGVEVQSISAGFTFPLQAEHKRATWERQTTAAQLWVWKWTSWNPLNSLFCQQLDRAPELVPGQSESFTRVQNKRRRVIWIQTMRRVCVLEEPGSWFFTGGTAVGVFSLGWASQAGLCVLWPRAGPVLEDGSGGFWFLFFWRRDRFRKCSSAKRSESLTSATQSELRLHFEAF